MISPIFSIFAVAIIIGILYGIINGPLFSIFSYYGGFLGTLIAFAINTVEWCFICFVVGMIIPFIDFGLGLILGPVYCAYCWIFKKENKLLKFIFGMR